MRSLLLASALVLPAVAAGAAVLDFETYSFSNGGPTGTEQLPSVAVPAPIDTLFFVEEGITFEVSGFNTANGIGLYDITTPGLDPDLEEPNAFDSVGDTTGGTRSSDNAPMDKVLILQSAGTDDAPNDAPNSTFAEGFEITVTGGSIDVLSLTFLDDGVFGIANGGQNNIEGTLGIDGEGCEGSSNGDNCFASLVLDSPFSVSDGGSFFVLIEGSGGVDKLVFETFEGPPSEGVIPLPASIVLLLGGLGGLAMLRRRA